MTDKPDFLERYTNVREWQDGDGWFIDCPVCGQEEALLVQEPNGGRRLFFDSEECWAAYGEPTDHKPPSVTA